MFREIPVRTLTLAAVYRSALNAGSGQPLRIRESSAREPARRSFRI
jgi:hypothetical protein